MRKSRLSALQQLQQARSGAKRTQQYDISESGPAFIEMSEEEYQKHVERNKQQKFIVDDHGIGYDDEGEDDWEDEEEDEPKKLKQEPKNSITKFMKPGVPQRRVKPVRQTTIQESTKIMDSLTSLLDDDSIDVQQVLNLNQSKSYQGLAPTRGANLGDIVRQQRAKMTQKYSEPPPVAEIPVEPAKEFQVVREDIGVDTIIPDEPTEEIIIEQNEELVVKPDDEVQKGFEEQVQDPDAMEIDEPEIPSIDFQEQGQQEIIECQDQMQMFYYDAYEDKDLARGVVFVFGKIYQNSQFSSACVRVESVDRIIYFKIREEYEERVQEVLQEMNEIKERYNIQSMGVRIVKRRYAFEIENIPYEADYVKVAYSSRYPPIEYTQGRTFSHAFGANNSLVENLLVKRQMKGPCWINLIGARQSSQHFSHCKQEFSIEHYKNIQVIQNCTIQPPKLKVLTFQIKTFRNDRNQNEICGISGLLHSQIAQDNATLNPRENYQKFTIIRKMYNQPDNFDRNGPIEIVSGERYLLNSFLAKLIRLDPDLIASHELNSAVLEILYNRMTVNQINTWSRVGRLIRQRNQFKKPSFQGNWMQRMLTAGRLSCDTFDIIQGLSKQTNYSLSHLVQNLLQEKMEVLDQETIEDCIQSPEGCMFLANNIEKEAYYVMELMISMNIIPLSKQLTCIAGNLWTRSLQNARAERNEMLLIHEFHKFKFIIPDKQIMKNQNQKRQAKYLGGRVIEPKVGLYDKIILLLDFNSLYPSIIQEFNLCFTTVVRQKGEDASDSVGLVPDQSDKSQKGILPNIIFKLVRERRQARQKMANEKNQTIKKQLDIKQLALKLTANSMYGCLGFKQSRFYAMPIAALITQLGRQILEKTEQIARNELHLDVIYGDTDSIMINSNTQDLPQALEIAKTVKQRINKQYRQLEIELDGIFRAMLLYKKKKYAAVKVNSDGTELKEIKGLDMVRRDWCELSKSICYDCLNILLDTKNREDIPGKLLELLEERYQQIQSNQISLGDYIITKQLTKQMSDYKQTNLPHLVVAQRMMEMTGQNLLKHFIPYIITEGNEEMAKRARHPDDVMNSKGALQVDIGWYIQQQVLPPVIRLCSVMEELPPGQIAQVMGQDGNKYIQQQQSQLSIFLGKIDYTVSIPLKCNACQVIQEFPNKLAGFIADFKCRTEGCNNQIREGQLSNQIDLFIHKSLSTYYQGGFVCQEACGFTTKSLNIDNCQSDKCSGKMVRQKQTDEINKQLSSLKERFNLDLYKNMQWTQTERLFYESIFKKLDKVLKDSIYQQINLKPLCSGFELDYNLII